MLAMCGPAYSGLMCCGRMHEHLFAFSMPDVTVCTQQRLAELMRSMTRAVLLEACGGYFSRGSAGRKLDRFLAYFQRYLLAKPPLPLDVEFDVQVWGGAA